MGKHIDLSGKNCRWATCKQQGNNTRSCRFITYNGDTKTMREWEEHLGLGRGVISFRLKNGWTEEESLKIKDGRKAKRAALEKMKEGK